VTDARGFAEPSSGGSFRDAERRLTSAAIHPARLFARMALALSLQPTEANLSAAAQDEPWRSAISQVFEHGRQGDRVAVDSLSVGAARMAEFIAANFGMDAGVQIYVERGPRVAEF